MTTIIEATQVVSELQIDGKQEEEHIKVIDRNSMNEFVVCCVQELKNQEEDDINLDRKDQDGQASTIC